MATVFAIRNCCYYASYTPVTYARVGDDVTLAFNVAVHEHYMQYHLLVEEQHLDACRLMLSLAKGNFVAFD